MTRVAVREGRLVVPTCPSCGCRLEKKDTHYAHFMKWAGWVKKDARGCRCALLELKFTIQNGIAQISPELY